MQSYSHQIDDTLTQADLPNLGSQLQLPAGWGFRARVVSDAPMQNPGPEDTVQMAWTQPVVPASGDAEER